MIVANAYSELPELGYVKTVVPMSGPDGVIEYIQSLSVLTSIKRMVYFMVRNESENAEHGINNNLGGFQGDGARWPAQYDAHIVGTVTIHENPQPGQPGSGKSRIFLAFDKWQSSVDMLAGEVESRGMFIDGVSVVTELDLVTDYYREWVTGQPTAEPPQAVINTFTSIYGQALALFRDEPAAPVVASSNLDPTEELNQQQLDQINQGETTA
jgi:hypothetical protein